MTFPTLPIRLALAAALATCALIATPYATHALAAPGADAIFAIGDGGFLDPIAVRKNGTFISPGSNDGGPSQSLANASMAALASAGNRVHVLFGGRVVATVPAKVDHTQATITVPPSLHLIGHVSALASTLGGYATSARRAPTAHERSLALAAAASKLNTTPARLTVRNLTGIDLGRGIAFVGSVDLRGAGTPRTDKRLFFVLDAAYRGTGFVLALANVQTIKVTEPLLEEPAEYLVDALDLGNNTPALVTSIIGYDANTYAIYTRAKTGPGWKSIYGGGGAAM
ncbi:MAG: hypothetical protein M3169_15500 [Candidatus Eremiobacteraeota bacterium]|nr:hypothetical protein [Candidatus Eremiobacteraeota bacterium]